MSKKDSTANDNKKYSSFVFKKTNYQLFVLSILIVAIGFFLMMGTEDIYSFTKITLAPFIIVAGFAVGFIAILYKPKNK